MNHENFSFFYDASADVLYLSVDAPLPVLGQDAVNSLNWTIGEGRERPLGLTIVDFRQDWQHCLPILARTVASGFQMHLREAHEVLKWHLWNDTKSE